MSAAPSYAPTSNLAVAPKPQPAAAAKTDEKYLEQLKRNVVAAMDTLEDARKEAGVDADYFHGKQYTADELRAFADRNQPAITFNRIKTAINGFIGIVARGKTDPKAFGRTPEDGDAAEVATDSLRYVNDISRFNTKRLYALWDMLVPGVCVGMVEIDREDGEIKIIKCRSEEYYYDPYSREGDFGDARYEGLAKWMDEADVVTRYPDHEDLIKSSVENWTTVSDSFKDRPQRAWSWADRRSRRIMVFEHYSKQNDGWHKCVFVAGGVLEEGPSPYTDDKGKPRRCLRAQSAFVDLDNQRYGLVRDMRGPQDALNKSRSKAVHILNVNQVRVDPGVKDVDDVRREAAKADGVFEFKADQFELLSNLKQIVPAHIDLMRDAKGELERLAPTPGIVGRQGTNQSGRAILAEQQAGLTEQAILLEAFDDWTLRLWRDAWSAIKQFWTAPKYVRVTDDEMAPRYILLNGPEPVMGPDGQPVIDPQTGQPQMRMRRPAEMDVDIIVDSSPDTAALQEEQFAKLGELIQAGVPIPPDALIESSSLPKKKMIIERMQKAAQQQQGAPNPMQIEEQKAQLQTQAKLQQTQIDAQAHAQELQRNDEADARKVERQSAYEERKFYYDMQRLDAQARSDRQKHLTALEADHVKRTNELNHAAQSKQMDLDFTERAETRKHELAVEGERKKADAQAQGEVAKAKVQAEAHIPGLDKLGKGLEAMSLAIDKMSRPRRLVKDAKTGEKRLELVPEAYN
jgi:hypothetical protein